MASTIITKNGTSGAPSSLTAGELAINTTDGGIYYGSTGGTSVSSSFMFGKITSSGTISSSGITTAPEFRLTANGNNKIHLTATNTVAIAANDSDILEVSDSSVDVGVKVVATQLESNISTGTAPLIVASTTEVSNLKAATAGTARTVTEAAQTTITSVGTLTTLTVDNITIDGSTITAASDMALVATGNDITVDTDNFIIESATESAPLLTLKTTHTTVNKQGEIRFVKDAADTEDGESLGMISFYGEDEGNNEHKFAHIRSKIAESDEGAEGGHLLFAIATHDGELINGLQLIDGNAEDEIDVTIANGTSSVTTIAGTLNMADTQAMTNAGLLSVANQSNITGLGTISSGVWNGTAINQTYLVGQSGTNTGDQTSVSGNAGTATNLVASTSTAVGLGTIELGHATDTTIARSAAGVATIESKIVQTKDKVIHLEQGTFSDNIATTEHFFPSVTTSESPSFTNVVTPFVMPTAGKLLKIHMKTNQNQNTSSNVITYKLYNVVVGDNWNDDNKNLLGAKLVTGLVKSQTMIADFTTGLASGEGDETNAFAAGDIIGISLTNSQDLATVTKYVYTFVFELDFNAY